MAEFLPATYGHLAEFGSIVIAEILFSLDNIIHVEHFSSALPARERAKALRWGLLGALFLRALSLVLMTLAKSFYWIMLLGSIHLIVTASIWFFGLISEEKEKQSLAAPVTKSMSLLKAVVLIELTDIFFSVDNVAVAVSISQNIWVSFAGVAMGLVIVRLLWRNLKYWSRRYPRLTDTSQLVAGMLGLQTLAKLLLHLKVSPWLDLAIVATAILLGLTFDTRAFGTKLRIKVTLLLIATLMCLSVLLEIFFK
jgi:predicted tellurium resistance membrane protein TerC